MFWAFSSHTHFWWNPFSCIKKASSSKGSFFLAFHGKKYDPTFDWHDDDGLLQDLRTHAPYCHVDTKVSFFSLVSLLEKMLLHISLKVSWWDIVIWLFWKFWGIARLVMLENIGFGAFLKCFLFYLFFSFLWWNLDNVGGLWNFDSVGRLWCCWMNFGLDFGSISIVKILG